MVLTKMKETVEAYLGRKVTRAVVAVPAYFNDAQISFPNPTTFSCRSSSTLDPALSVSYPSVGCVPQPSIAEDFTSRSPCEFVPGRGGSQV